MKKLLYLFLSSSLFFGLLIQFANAQIPVTVTNYNNTIPPLNSSYSSLSDALTALNSVTGIGAAITLTLSGGNSETAPAKGFTIGNATINPLLSSSNTITIVASGGTVTINAGVGTATPSSSEPDGILKIVGANYITLDGITFTDGNTTNPETMEFGVALFRLSSTDGAQNNTIKNCTFNMQAVNNASGSLPMVEGSVGILLISSTPTAATTMITPTLSVGSNSYNKFYTNNIYGGNYGIVLSGNPNINSNIDSYNDIGGSSSGQGNTINNFGGATSASNPSAGIRTIYQWNLNIGYNNINNNDGSGVNHPNILRGIYTESGGNNTYVNHNTVTVKGGGTTSTVSAIENSVGAPAPSVNIEYNTIQNCSYSTGTTATMYGIYNSASSASTSIHYNTIQNSSYTGSVTTGTFTGIASISTTGLYMHYNTINNLSIGGTGNNSAISVGSPSGGSVLNNTISNITRTGLSGDQSGILLAGATGGMSFSLNTIEDISWTSLASTGNIYGINTNGSSNAYIENSIIRNLSTPATGTIYGVKIFSSGAAIKKTVRNNQIYNFSTVGGGAGGATFCGIYCYINDYSESDININTIYALNSTGTTGGTGGSVGGINLTATRWGHTIYKNNIYNLSSNSTNPMVYGIMRSTTYLGDVYIYNNFISDLRAPAANATNALIGIYIAGNYNTFVYSNTVYLNGTSTGTNFGSSAFFNNVPGPGGQRFYLSSNIFTNVSVPNGTGYTVAFRGLTNEWYMAPSNNNCFFAGTPGTKNLIYYNGTNSYQTISDYKSRYTSPNRIDSCSVSEFPPFVNITTTPYDLHISTATPTLIESHGITTYTTDFDGNPRYPNSGYPNNPSYPAYAPDIGADEFGGINIDIEGPTISYTPLSNNYVGNDQVLTATITDSSGVPESGIGLPVLYYKINSGSYIPVTGVSIGSNQYTFTFGAATTTSGDIVSYYVSAQDNVTPPNPNCYPRTGADGFSTNPPTNSTPTTTPSTFTAIGYISGTYQVGSDQVRLKKLSDVAYFLNNSIITSDIIFELNSFYDGTTGETFPIVLPQFSQSGGWWYVTIRIKSGAGLRTTSGSSASSIIQFSNADRYILDGREGGTGSTVSWNIQNTNTAASTAAIHLLGSTNGSVRNTVKYCNISCNAPQNTGAGLTFGIIIGGSSLSISSLGFDNDSTDISNNNITKVRYGIFINGASSTNPDQDVTVRENTIGPSSFGVNEIGLGGLVALNQLRLTVSQNEIRYVGGTFSNTSGGADRVGIAFATDATWPPSNTFIKNSKITRNKIHHIIDERTFSAAGIVLACIDGTNNTSNEVSNNSIYQVLSNGTSGNYCTGIGLYTGKNDLIAYNSIYLTGDTDPNASATTPTQSGFCISLNTTFTIPTILDNIGFMDLTSSSAPALKNGCIGIATGYSWGTGTQNYNDLHINTGNSQSYTGNSGLQTSPTWYLNLFGTGSWNSATSKDGNSVMGNPAFTSATDLSINNTSPDAWNVHGMGQPVATISTDINGNTRSTSVAGGSTDIGAYNATPSSTPASAIESGTLTNNSTTTYTLPNGRVLGSISWGAGGTVPSSIDMVFYPGVNPPGSSGFAIANGYWVITPTGGSGYTYDITLNYDDAQIGNIIPESNLRVLKSDDGGTSYTPFLSFTPNTSLNTITVTGLNSFSLFVLGDNDAPLPVNLTSFTSNINGRNIKLNWITSTEQNNTGFDVERKTLEGIWVKAGFVQGKGTTTTPSNYSFEDKNLNTGKYNYRLKQIDVNGNFEYYDLNAVLEIGLPTKFDISQNYPNPFNPVTKVDFQLPVDSKVSILVYDITGRKIKSLINNEMRNAGYYTAEFIGSSFSSGTYFYIFIAEAGGKQKVITKKMVLIK